MSEVAVRLEGLTKRYRRRPSWRELARLRLAGPATQVLAGVDFEVRRGELFGLLGPNGAGKTTLLKILATLVEPDEGRARVHGLDVTEAPDRVRRVLASVPPEERSLYWRLGGYENLELFAALYGLRGCRARERCERLLDLVGLADAGRKIVGHFSSGMRQRLLIARALLADPKVLLLDEPTRTLDPVAARDLRTLLREELCGRQGRTVLLATHNPEEALHLCDRVGVLDRGRLVALGPAAQLAREHAGDRWLARTRRLEETVLRRLVAEGLIVGWRALPSEPGRWRQHELEIPGGEDRAADVLARLVELGARPAAFEPRASSLAALIERLADAPPPGSGADVPPPGRAGHAEPDPRRVVIRSGTAG